MSFWARVRYVAVGVIGVYGVQGCGNDSCADELLDKAVAFIEAHQSCETESDCVVFLDHCGTLPGGLCGQLSMNRAGAESSDWQVLDRKLAECAPKSCSQCGAALLPTCIEGRCSSKD